MLWRFSDQTSAVSRCEEFLDSLEQCRGTGCGACLERSQLSSRERRSLPFQRRLNLSLEIMELIEIVSDRIRRALVWAHFRTLFRILGGNRSGLCCRSEYSCHVSGLDVITNC